MPEVIKDSAIKLFGRTISLPRNREFSANDSSSSSEPADHSPPSSSSSPRELSFSTEHEAKRDNKVCVSLNFFFFFKLCC